VSARAAQKPASMDLRLQAGRASRGVHGQKRGAVEQLLKPPLSGYRIDMTRKNPSAPQKTKDTAPQANIPHDFGIPIKRVKASGLLDSNGCCCYDTHIAWLHNSLARKCFSSKGWVEQLRSGLSPAGRSAGSCRAHQKWFCRKRLPLSPPRVTTSRRNGESASRMCCLRSNQGTFFSTGLAGGNVR
jgi:hypothetical protein